MAHITIDDIDPLISYTVGASARSSFPVPFAYFESSNLVVTSGITTLVLGTDYSVAGTAVDAGFSSGTVTLDTAVSNTTVVIERVLPIERTTDFPNSGPLAISALNTQFDKIIAICQQLQSAITALGTRLTDWIATISTALTADVVTVNFATRTAVTLSTVSALTLYVRTAGYAAAGDGGAALYKRVSAEPSHTGKVQTSDSVWFELAERRPNAGMFGAFPSVSDNANALQQFFDYLAHFRLAGDIDGGVYAYLVELEITSGICVAGSGINGTTGGDTLNGTVLSRAAGINGIKITTAQPVTLRDFELRGADTTSTGLTVAPTSGINTHSDFTRLKFYNGLKAISTVSAAGLLIEKCFLEQLYGNAVTIQDVVAPDAGDSIITRCTFSGVLGANIVILSSGGLRVVNNKINGGSYGILMQLDPAATTGVLIVSANSMEGITGPGIQLEQQAPFTGSYQIVIISSNEIAAATSGISIAAGGGASNWMTDLSIGGNVIFFGSSAAGASVGVDVARTTQFTMGINEIRDQGGHASSLPYRILSTVAIGLIDAQLLPGAQNPPANNSTTVTQQGRGQRGAQAVAVTTASGALFTGTAAVTFPVPYLIAPTHVSCNVQSLSGIGASAASPSTTGFTIVGFAAASGTYTIDWEASSPA
jgi:hypothetical protein